MINKRLLSLVPGSGRYIALNVFLQWIGLLAGIAAMFAIAHFFHALAAGYLSFSLLGMTGGILVSAAVIRALCTVGSAEMSYRSSAQVKKVLRRRIFEKIFRLGGSYREQMKTSEIVQVAVEGADQLETYFGSYLPQFFYSMAAPLTLFAVLARISFSSALLLFVCVPLIPVIIMLVQKWAKKLLARYWTQYTSLGDTFLENLQGLTTAKVYQADEMKQREMNEQAEHFRKITMKVLTMQLNSIAVMDLVAYGGTALGMIVAVMQFASGNISLLGCLLILLLAAEFFLPMRLLGSYFHIAMNGMAASQKIFRLLDLPETERGNERMDADPAIIFRNVSFSYDGKRNILRNLNFEIPFGKMTAIVGVSGSGKSTVSSLLMGRQLSYTGSILLGDQELRSVSEDELYRNVVYIPHHSRLFSGTVRDQLLMGNPSASEEEMRAALKTVKILDCLDEMDSLDTVISENGSNLSGGQCQRIAIARALLHNAEIYIFDEATSNIDAESEEAIMEAIRTLTGKKTVILITHRLVNAMEADRILVMNNGSVAESGTHRDVLNRHGIYKELWDQQQKLERYAGGMAV